MTGKLHLHGEFYRSPRGQLFWKRDDGMLLWGEDSKKWIEAFFSGPLHFWVSHAAHALEDPNGTVLLYHDLKEDWKKTGLPDIVPTFSAKTNDVRATLTQDSIDYIVGRTGKLWEGLGIRLGPILDRPRDRSA